MATAADAVDGAGAWAVARDHIDAVLPREGEESAACKGGKKEKLWLIP